MNKSQTRQGGRTRWKRGTKRGSSGEGKIKPLICLQRKGWSSKKKSRKAEEVKRKRRKEVHSTCSKKILAARGIILPGHYKQRGGKDRPGDLLQAGEKRQRKKRKIDSTTGSFRKEEHWE